MSAVSTMILRSMRMIGEKARGGTLDANESTECLAEFNTFLEATALERLLVYTITEQTHALTASTSTYSIGPGATINITRPVRIVDPCFVRDSSGYDSPVKIVTVESYGRIVDKDSGYTYPSHLYYDAGFSATSTGTLYLYPSPSGDLTLHFNVWKQIGTVSTLSVNLALPPGYQLFLESNFAIHLAAGLTPISEELKKIARESKAAVKSLNVPETIMQHDAGVVYARRGSIFTGP